LGRADGRSSWRGTTPDVVPDLSGSVAGVAGSAARHDEYTGESRYVTGMVALDAPQLAEIVARRPVLPLTRHLGA